MRWIKWMQILTTICCTLLLLYTILVRPGSIQLATFQPSWKETIDKWNYGQKANTSRSCRVDHFQDVVLALHFNMPYYDNIPILHQLYDGVFGKIFFCGSEYGRRNAYSPDVRFKGGYLFGYECLGKAIDKHPGYAGYLFGNDDMIINWWSLIGCDKQKLWQGGPTVYFEQDPRRAVPKEDHWPWWKRDVGLDACLAYYKALQTNSTEAQRDALNATEALRIYLKNGKGEPKCGKGFSDFFYIPGHLSARFRSLSSIAYSNRLFLEIAVTNIMRSLDEAENFEVLNGVYLPLLNVVNLTSTKTLWRIYRRSIAFIHPVKMGSKDFDMTQLNKNVIDFKRYLCKE